MPSGPFAVVEALKGAALSGQLEQLRRAVARVQEHGEGLPKSLDSMPCSVMLDKGAVVEGAPAVGLWTWARSRLQHLEEADAELAKLLDEGRQAIETSKARFPRQKLQKFEKDSSPASIKKLRRAVTMLQSRGSPREACEGIVPADQPTFFMVTQERLSAMACRLQETLKEIDRFPGLNSNTRKDADVMLRSIEAAQHALFDRWTENRTFVERDLREASDAASSATAESVERLWNAVMAAQRETGARLLLGEAAIRDAEERGLGLSSIGEREPPNPWSTLKGSMPPWEPSFRRACVRLAILQRAPSDGGALAPHTKASTSGVASAVAQVRKFGSVAW